ncbi:glutaminase [Halobacteriovorax marinus]|uniref:Glutaminase n=1 Tax=Halobacteriovorax marinus TaxID=97084 RepID=A0A1Y5FBR0_9BACT|nr:glutaminase [Halobacteriovorax marinus]
MKPNFQKIIEEISREVLPLLGLGKVANYIPELAKIDPRKIGISICDIDGNVYSTGDCKTLFSIQSISKLFTLCLAMKLEDNELWNRVGMEPSGTAFNSLVLLEEENGIPRNPFINAGAIVITDIILGKSKHPSDSILKFMREITQNKNIKFNDTVAVSERKHGHRNAALSYLMKDYGNIHKEVEEVLNLYCRHCSLELNCEDLARASYFLINQGKDIDGKTVLIPRDVKRVNSLMMTSGLYNNAGKFAFEVGLPAKSGVGGGIVGVLPGQFSISVWSPELNESGNSLIGMKVMEMFTTKSGMSVF